jgi:hypothetical protein
MRPILMGNGERDSGWGEKGGIIRIKVVSEVWRGDGTSGVLWE